MAGNKSRNSRSTTKRRAAEGTVGGLPMLYHHDLRPENPVQVQVSRIVPGTEEESVFTLHPALEVGVVTRGSYERDHGHGWFRLETGQGWACGPLERHRWRVSKDVCERVVFVFSVSVFEPMPNLAGFDPTALFRSSARLGALGSADAEKSQLLKLGHELAGKYRDPIPPGQAWIDLMRTIDSVSQCIDTEVVERSAADKIFLADGIVPAMALVETSLDRRVPLTEAAAACNMSRGGFARLFVKTTGQTFAAFGLGWRLSEAARFLRNTNLSIKEIAVRCGFMYDTHLHAAFRDHFHVSPGDYRKQGGEVLRGERGDPFSPRLRRTSR